MHAIITTYYLIHVHVLRMTVLKYAFEMLVNQMRRLMMPLEGALINNKTWRTHQYNAYIQDNSITT